MKCFTVFEQTIHEGITIDGKGIGFLGLFAHIPEDNKVFPSPEIHSSGYNFNFPGTQPTASVIYYADVFLFRGHNVEGKRCQYEAMLYAEQDNNSKDALVMWVITKNSPNDCDMVTEHNCEKYDETTRLGGYWHVLVQMKPNSYYTLHTNTGDVILTWNGTDLSINKISK